MDGSGSLNDQLVDVAGLNITCGYDRRKLHVVESVSFQIRRGQMLALVGESGSGKTTIGYAIT